MSLYKRYGKWHVDFIDANGKRIRQSTETADKQQAQEIHDKLKAQAWRIKNAGEKPKYSWQEAVVRYLSEQSHKKSLVTDKYHLRWINEHLRNKQLHEITKKTLDDMKAAKLKTGVTNATVNRMLSTVRKILSTAKNDWEWLDTIPNVKMLSEPKSRVRWLTQGEAIKLIEQSPEHLKVMIRFTLATGLRESNVTGLLWSQVDLERRCAWIHPEQAKAGKAIAVPLNDDAITVLRSQIGKHNERVFTYKGEPILKANSTAWENALKRAGIEDFRWHDLRHTWASWHVQGGTPLNILKELGGWADYDMVLRYAHLSSEHLARHANVTILPPQQKMRLVK
jgi:integrase